MDVILRKLVSDLLATVDMTLVAGTLVRPGEKLSLSLNVTQADFDGLTNAVVPFSVELTSPLSLTNVLMSPKPKLDVDVGQVNLTDATSSIGSVDLTVPISLDLVGKEASPPVGESDLHLTMQEVELPRPVSERAVDVDPNASVENALGYLVPQSVGSTGLPAYGLGQNVKGLIARVKGAIALAEKVTGTLAATLVQTAAGTITGKLTQLTKGTLELVQAPTTVGADVSKIAGNLVRDLATTRPVVTVSWEVLDEDGSDLFAPGKNLCAVKGDRQGLIDVALPVLAFLPEFVDYVDDKEPFATRNVCCSIEVTIGSTKIPKRLEPVPIKVPKVPLPSVLIMTRDPIVRGGDGKPQGSGGGVMVATPKQPEMNDVAKIRDLLVNGPTALRALIDTVKNTVSPGVKNTVSPGDFSLPAGYIGYLDGMLRVLDTVGHFLDDAVHGGDMVFVQENEVADLFNVGYWRTHRLRDYPWVMWSWHPFEDCLSSLTFIGLPGSEVRCYVAKGAGSVERHGAFGVRLGSLVPCAVISNLDTSGRPEMPVLELPQLDAEIVPRWLPENSPNKMFENQISSFRFSF